MNRSFPPSDPINPTVGGRGLMGLFLLILLVFVVCGAWFYSSQRDHLRNEVEQNLMAIAEMKTSQIADWRAEHLRDAEILAEFFLDPRTNQWLEDPQSSSSGSVLDRIRSLGRRLPYSNIELVNTGGKILLGLTGQTGPIPTEVATAMGLAFQTRQCQLSDLYVSPEVSSNQMGVIVPLFSEIGRPTGAVLLSSRADAFLYPLIQSWPTSSRTAETLLVRRDGDSVLFLNELRHQKDTALKLRIPLTNTEVPAVQAALGTEGMWEGIDYRGIPVISILKSVPDSPWFMVVKIDREEAFATWRFRSILILLLIGAILLALSAVFGVLWQRRSRSHFEALYRLEAARGESELRYHTTLMSIGDAVIATDTEGRVELLNPVAEKLTRWPMAEARGKPLTEVFRIINEHSRRPVEDPVAKVLREGKIVGLANHTALIARDGTEWPIADAAAPIRNEEGRIAGVVLVFRDQTRERYAERQLQHERDRARRYVDLAGVLFVALDDQGRVTMVNPRTCQILGCEETEMLGKDWFESFLPGHSRDEIRRTYADLMAGKIQSLEYVENAILTRDGQERIIAWHNTLLRDETGTILGTLSSGQDITERKFLEKTRSFLLQCGNSGEDFFQSLARYLSQTLDMGYVCIDRLEGDGLNARTVAVWNDSGFEDNMSYALKDTPCGKVVGQTICCFPREVCQLFPQDAVLRQIRAESYIGTTLWSFDGKPIGLIAIIGQKPMTDPSLAETLLKVVSPRAASELERRQAEEALRESERRFRQANELLEAVTKGVGVIIAATDADLRYTYFNPTYQEEIRRLTGKELSIGMGMAELFADQPEQQKIVLHEWSIPLRGESSSRTLEFGDPDRLRKVYRIFHTPLWNPEGHVVGAGEVAMDITDLARAEAALRESREDMARAQAVGNIGSWRLDIQRNVLTWSAENHRIFGIPEGTPLTYETFLSTVHPDDREYVDTQWKAGLRGEPYDVEHRLLVNGEVKWVREKAYLEFDSEGELIGGFGITQDITERRKAQEAVLVSEVRYRRLFETARDGILILDVDTGRIVDVNPFLIEMLGYSHEEFLQKKLWEIGLFKNIAATREAFLELQDKGYVRYENLPLETKNGRRIAVEFVSNVYSVDHGNVVQCNIRNISDRVQAEEALRRSHDELERRVEARTRDLALTTRQLRALATELILTEERERRTVAMALHDSLGPLLSFSKRELGTLRKTIPARFGESLDHIRGQISQAIEQTRSLTIDLSPPTLYTLGLGHALEELGERFAAEHHFRCVFESQGSIPPLPDDIQVLLYRSVRELFVNIVKHAQATSVQLTLSTENNCFRIAVEDDGLGIHETSRSSVEGMHDGFGLFTIRQRVEQAGGRLEIQSCPGKGTLVAVRIPLNELKPRSRRKKT